ncbi:nitrate reductase [Streptomyces sp. NRRL F-4489]|uniref:nitrate reductase molybdenum cofactor assembly chaperone n=1 Tax=Streptomyces sp. NRRL F-4489 TaxID=1609095 RepID=UPI00074A46D7|nr:nitrate reductase molybdenum cofactor assembly chaperone [Streptomyces sp. NRRL F-4489]KUL34393.1 nitrate reductase [Streptomyces sp. NRRL F-4489]
MSARTVLVRGRRRRATRLTPREARERSLLLRLLSLLLQYPDDELASARGELADRVDSLPPSPAARHLTAFTGWFAGQSADALRAHYVEIFDLRRKSSLYLTYYLHGDTRRRGMALLTLNRRYRAAGWRADGGELPDHLPLVLEFAALAGPGAGEAPLRQHRRGLALIHRALADADSPYRHVLAALLALLPPATAADLRAVAELAAQGPPREDTGLEPYGAYGSGEFAPPGTFAPPEQAPPTLMPTPAPAPHSCPSSPSSTPEGPR